MKKKLEFYVVPGIIINKYLNDYLKTKEIVKIAYDMHGKGQTVCPNSLFLRYDENSRNRLSALTAHLKDPINTSGVKWISSYPDNIHNGIQRASAAIILNDFETGYPVACLEGALISASRTAASAVLFAELLDESHFIKNLGIIGTGFIAKNVYDHFIHNSWDIENVRLHDIDPSESTRFFEQTIQKKLHKNISIYSTSYEVIENSDVIILATTASEPHITDTKCLEAGKILLNISLRDLGPEIILKSFNIADDIEHVLNADTSVHITEKKVGHRSFMNGTIIDLLNGSLMLDRSRPIIFSPFGLGILDIALSFYIFEAAKRNNDTIPIDKFFYNIER